MKKSKEGCMRKFEGREGKEKIIKLNHNLKNRINIFKK